MSLQKLFLYYKINNFTLKDNKQIICEYQIEACFINKIIS